MLLQLSPEAAKSIFSNFFALFNFVRICTNCSPTYYMSWSSNYLNRVYVLLLSSAEIWTVSRRVVCMNSFATKQFWANMLTGFQVFWIHRCLCVLLRCDLCSLSGKEISLDILRPNKYNIPITRRRSIWNWINTRSKSMMQGSLLKLQRINLQHWVNVFKMYYVAAFGVSIWQSCISVFKISYVAVIEKCYISIWQFCIGFFKISYVAAFEDLILAFDSGVASPKKVGVRAIFLCCWAVNVTIYIHGTPQGKNCRGVGGFNPPGAVVDPLEKCQNGAGGVGFGQFSTK